MTVKLSTDTAPNPAVQPSPGGQELAIFTLPPHIIEKIFSCLPIEASVALLSTNKFSRLDPTGLFYRDTFWQTILTRTFSPRFEPIAPSLDNPFPNYPRCQRLYILQIRPARMREKLSEAIIDFMGSKPPSTQKNDEIYSRIQMCYHAFLMVCIQNNIQIASDHFFKKLTTCAYDISDYCYASYTASKLGGDPECLREIGTQLLKLGYASLPTEDITPDRFGYDTPQLVRTAIRESRQDLETLAREYEPEGSELDSLGGPFLRSLSNMLYRLAREARVGHNEPASSGSTFRFGQIKEAIRDKILKQIHEVESELIVLEAKFNDPGSAPSYVDDTNRHLYWEDLTDKKNYLLNQHPLLLVRLSDGALIAATKAELERFSRFYRWLADDRDHPPMGIFERL